MNPSKKPPEQKQRDEPVGGRAPVLVVATSNEHKVEEISSCLATLAGRALSVRGAGLLPPGPVPDETGETFLENARIKARACAARAFLLPPGERPDWVVADDSGLEVDALGGAPGVHSARFAGPGARDSDNNRKLLDALAGLPAEKRGASFVCVLVALEVRGEGPEAGDIHVEGRTRGRILDAPRGRGGFGYDPLFLVPELGKTYAELEPEEKNGTSHRGKALAALQKSLWPALEERGRAT